ncbi:TPA: naked cuticle homolog 2 [Bos taurus]|nr:TPA: naked cuticle homolog 2 [Bos taurus]
MWVTHGDVAVTRDDRHLLGCSCCRRRRRLASEGAQPNREKLSGSGKPGFKETEVAVSIKAPIPYTAPLQSAPTQRHDSSLFGRTLSGQLELLGGDLREGPFRDNQCPLEVMLPPEKAEACEGPGQLFCVDDGERAASREGARGLGKRRLNVDAVQCDVSVEEDDHQEWTFTLYGFDNSGKATREDMSSLMHTIYEVVDASVHRCSGSSKTLRVKLTVSPEPSSKRKDGPPAAQDREASRCRAEAELSEDPRVADRRLSAHVRRPNADPHPCSERGPYCVDENTERRNHYLDLAGIENYASKFGPGSPPTQARPEPPARASHPQGRSRSQESDVHAAHHRRCPGLAEFALPAAEPLPRALDLPPRPKGPERPFLRSPQGSGRPPGAPSGLRPGRFSFGKAPFPLGGRERATGRELQGTVRPASWNLGLWIPLRPDVAAA